jgi:hypothetical protein
LQQLSARENISPDNFSVHGNYDAYHILIAKLADDTFVVALYRFDHGVNLLLNFVIVQAARYSGWWSPIARSGFPASPQPDHSLFVQGKRDPSARGQRLSCLITHGPPNKN